jgi:transposase
MRWAIKNRVHAIVAGHGVIHQHADLFGKAGREFLATVELRPAPRQRIDGLLALVENFDREIDATAKEIDRQAKGDERVAPLCQIHGIGRYTAMLIIAEIGDVRRFPTAPHLCAWAGLTPTVRRSDGKARLGNISRQGSSVLRWAVVEAATRTHPWRAAARAVRADRQTPRAQSRPRRCRAPNPHPQLLRPTRRRDPLPAELPPRRTP